MFVRPLVYSLAALVVLPNIGYAQPSSATAVADSAAGAIAILPANSQIESTDGRAHFSWVRGVGADRCPPQSTVQERIVQRLGHDPFASDAPQQIEAIVTREPLVWRAVFFVRDEHGVLQGTRELVSEARECGPVVSAISLAIALAIDPEAALRPSPPEVVRPPVVPAAPPRVEMRTVYLAQPARMPVALELGSMIQLGTLSSPSAGVIFRASMQLHPRIGLAVSSLWLSNSRLDGEGFSVDFGLMGGALHGVVNLVHNSRFALAAEAGVLLGALDASVLRVAMTDSGTRGFVAVSAGIRTELHLTAGLFLSLAAQGLVPITRYQFVSTGQRREVLFDQPWLQLNASLSLGWRFR
ncbi:MAG: hypothetical protein Q8Q09_23720 [Deltaproteobacteria bacterium]|nr:hypothetical protein [Deltaproteobacteria bacterium]